MELLLTLFLCGDVMTGRGVDQAFAQSADPTLHEPYMHDARDYLRLAQRESGDIDLPIDDDYIWGAALEVLREVEPAARIINLETAVTTSDDWDRAKGIHYRMHPRNVRALAAADIDVCVVANNHVLDWGPAGLRQTLDALHDAGIETAGAGTDDDAAEAPAVVDLPGGRRLLLFAFGLPTSGVPRDWAATPKRPGVNYLPNLSDQSFERVRALIADAARPDDLVVFSVHWGGNWGYDIPADQVRFAHRLIDDAGVDVVHGHSSHHVMGFEVYHRRPIFYGCGDFLNDYEGITGHESYRPDLTLMYLPSFDPDTGHLRQLRLVPMLIRHLRLIRADRDDAEWLRDRLNRECEQFGLEVQLAEDGTLHVPPQQWVAE